MLFNFKICLNCFNTIYPQLENLCSDSYDSFHAINYQSFHSVGSQKKWRSIRRESSFRFLEYDLSKKWKESHSDWALFLMESMRKRSQSWHYFESEPRVLFVANHVSPRLWPSSIINKTYAKWLVLTKNSRVLLFKTKYSSNNVWCGHMFWFWAPNRSYHSINSKVIQLFRCLVKWENLRKWLVPGFIEP